MKTHLAAAAVALVLFTALATAQASVQVGDKLKLYDGLGTTGGGIFHVDYNNLANSSSSQDNGYLPAGTFPKDFLTFCVQTREFVSFSGSPAVSPEYHVWGISKTVLGLNTTRQDGTPLGSFAAWLYSGFLGVDGVSLASAGFNPGTLSHVNALQVGIWQSMGYSIPSVSYSTTILTALQNAYSSDTTWASQTADVNGNKTGNIKIMNLVKLYSNGAIKEHFQDQLVYIPPPLGPPPGIPEPMSFFVWSMLAMCVGSLGLRSRD